jgi:hypothetical protein
LSDRSLAEGCLGGVLRMRRMTVRIALLIVVEKVRLLLQYLMALA